MWGREQVLDLLAARLLCGVYASINDVDARLEPLMNQSFVPWPPFAGFSAVRPGLLATGSLHSPSRQQLRRLLAPQQGPSGDF